MRTTSSSVIVLALLLGVGCTDSPEGDSLWDEPGDPIDDKADSAGCVVAKPPASLGLDPFYQKYCSASGLTVVAAAVVPDSAVQHATRIMSTMLQPIPGVRDQLVSWNIRIGVIGQNQQLTDMPEYRTLEPSINQRARGLAHDPLISNSEENTLCYELTDGWRGENILVHEFAHAIKWALDVDPVFANRVENAYSTALAAGRYRNLYASTNSHEYFAEGVQNYFNVNLRDQDGPLTSEDLRAYDPTLWTILDETFEGAKLPFNCPPPPFARDGWYRIENVHRSALSIAGTKLATTANRDDQMWHVRSLPGGGFRLTNRSTGDERALAIVNGRATMVAAGSGANQTWRISPLDQGSFRIVNDALGSGRSLAAALAGAELVPEATALRMVQRWRFKRQ